MGFRRSIATFAWSVAFLGLLTGCVSFPDSNTIDASDFSSPSSSIAGEPDNLDQNSDDQIESHEQTEQEVDFRVTGGCYDSYEELGYYAIFEEFDDDCYLIVEVFPPEPGRYAELQYFDETWIEEASGETDSGGVLYLKVDPICDDGYWCDGIWEYRVTLAATGELPAERSPVFELDFIPWE